MVRIDMSEYMEKFSVQRFLIGARDTPWDMTKAANWILRPCKPYSVILLDDRKGPPGRVQHLLQVLDDTA